MHIVDFISVIGWLPCNRVSIEKAETGTITKAYYSLLYCGSGKDLKIFLNSTDYKSSVLYP